MPEIQRFFKDTNNICILLVNKVTYVNIANGG